MNQAITVLNAGSSSMKFSVYEIAGSDLRMVTQGQVDGIGGNPKFQAKDSRGKTLAETEIRASAGGFGHTAAFWFLIDWLRDQYASALSPVGVGHRVVHGGGEFINPTRIDAQVLERLEAMIPLAPLHLPHNIEVIKAVRRIRPDLPQVACFDTAFHQGRARVTEQFGLPGKFFDKGIRRWGFHGLSYTFIAQKFRELAPEIAKGRVIAAHLGSGASLCGMRDGKCVDTTMSFSVLDGLAMGTRCGSLDPGVLLCLLNEMSRDDLQSLLYTKSGLLGMSGISNDVRKLLASTEPLAAEAIDYFVYRAIREIGSMVAALEGLDALIFTAGIGENSPLIRGRICAGLKWLGLALDEAANDSGKNRISPPERQPSVWVIPTDEEIVIASQTLAVIRGK